ncbi:hypothetical protein P7K49_025054, partial [Saguinus oedipus]
ATLNGKGREEQQDVPTMGFAVAQRDTSKTLQKTLGTTATPSEKRSDDPSVLLIHPHIELH